MQKKDIKQKLARNGFVFTDLDSGVRVTALGPKSPADPHSDGERNTVVKAQRNGDVLERESCHNRAVAARRYVELVDEYSDT